MGGSGSLTISTCLVSLLLTVWISSLDSLTLEPPRPPTQPPIFDGEPFIVSWNIPNLTCNRYNITLNTSPYRGVSNPAKVPGQFLSLFYIDRLGLYPYVDQGTKHQFHGGVPQRGNLRESLAKAHGDIHHYIPSRSSQGLAVIDWEEWRPLWERNWGSKQIYQSLSVTYARRRNPALPLRRAMAQAKQRFQSAAKSYMLETLSLGTRLRPNYQWGFYLFPNCYNYGWDEWRYTGECPREVRRQNNQLMWLWEASTALYPSIYLQALLGDSHRAALMARHRLHEALRVAALPRRRRHTVPIYAYARLVFVDRTKTLLSLRDLIHTIGESAAMGASGAVLWGSSGDYDDKASCEALSAYLDDTINPYVVNVTVAAKLCADFLCKGKGRCVRRNFNSDTYLHLSADSFTIKRSEVTAEFTVDGQPSLQDLMEFAKGFTCQCYAGMNCDTKIPRPTSRPTHKRTTSTTTITTSTTTMTTTTTAATTFATTTDTITSIPSTSVSHVTSLTPSPTSDDPLSEVYTVESTQWTTDTLSPQSQTEDLSSFSTTASDIYDIYV
ncbi:hyaluronidase-1-like [Engraulis encrasicolus]|uniref:hyaluronidase-1-like n=1 Tax=Engraulis encrasicolus TaxID=184585 RepID=UPI002FD2F407